MVILKNSMLIFISKRGHIDIAFAVEGTSAKKKKKTWTAVWLHAAILFWQMDTMYQVFSCSQNVLNSDGTVPLFAFTQIFWWTNFYLFTELNTGSVLKEKVWKKWNE